MLIYNLFKKRLGDVFKHFFRALLHGAFTTPGLNSALLNGLKILTIT